MSEKTLKSRIVHKHDIEANWKLATNFSPRAGELIVYDPDENNPNSRAKIGDGKTNVNDLPFIESSKAEIADKAAEADHATSADTATKANSATKADSADSATKATHDGSGNVITDTYATKTELGQVSDLVGDTPVSEQISEAISEIPQADWNQTDSTTGDYIKNKPFGEVITYGDTLTWDGNTDGLEVGTVTYSDGSTYEIFRISELVPTFDELMSNGVSFTVQDGYVWKSEEYPGEFKTTNDNLVDIGAGCIYIAYEDDMSCTNDEGHIYRIPKKGIYCWSYSEEHNENITSLTINGYNGFPTTEINYLDPKYIKDMYYTSDPVETPIVEETTFEFVDGMGQLTAAQPLEVGQEYIINLDGVQYNSVCKEANLGGMMLPYLGNTVVIDGVDTGEIFFIAPTSSETELGIVVISDVTEHTVSIVSNISEIHQIDPKYIPDSVKVHDWNTMENRPFGEEIGWLAVVEEQSVTLDSDGRGNVEPVGNIYDLIHPGDQCTVKFDGVSYNVVAYEDGDACLRTDFTTASGVKVYMYDGTGIVSSSELAGEHTIEIGLIGNVITQIDNKYIDFPVTSVNGETGDVDIRAEDIGAAKKSDLDKKMDATNPTGTGSFSMNRKAGTTIGEYSFTGGYNTEASGDYSYAEGRDTHALGDYSHAEGNATTATRPYQHVQGFANIVDTEKHYLHIVGNGSFNQGSGALYRSNAHTLDYGGNAWFAGDVYVGGTGQDDENAKKLATEESVTDLSALIGDTAVATQISDAIDAIPQVDWNQNDSTATDYIKNRPFYEDITYGVVLEETEVQLSDMTGDLPPFELREGNNYTVTINGIDHEVICKVTEIEGINANILGNLYPLTQNEDDNTGEPFTVINIAVYGMYVISYFEESENITVKITGDITNIVQIPYKFVPNADFNIPVGGDGYIKNKPNIKNGEGVFSVIINHPDNIASGECSHVEGFNTTASGDYSHAEGCGTIASGIGSHAESNDTTASGDYSHAEGDSTQAIGDYSHAEGLLTTASGFRSHAEGYSTQASGRGSHAEGSITTASGQYSHAEGSDTTAFGDYSHAEGDSSNILPENIDINSDDSIIWQWGQNKFTLAKGQGSHAEGYNTLALGSYSHTEGNQTIAVGQSSHAEGEATRANGMCSHAEGDKTTASGHCAHAEGYNTIAQGHYQHAQGKFNIIDIRDQYAHIVGNGTANDKCSNAHTLDWGGNAWFQGEVKIGGTGQDDATAKTLATTEDVDAVKNDLLNGAGAAYDTLKELGDLIDDNTDAIDALEVIATGKADKSEVEALSTMIGDTAVAAQISNAMSSWELITVADIDEICGTVVEGSLPSSDIDELMAKLQ